MRNEEFVYEEFLVRKTDEENEELTSIKRLILGGKSRKKVQKLGVKKAKFDIGKTLMYKNAKKLVRW